MNKPAVIFDLDGTLWDARAGILKSWNLEAEKRGMQLKVDHPDQLTPLMGRTMDDICLEVFEDQPLETALPIFEQMLAMENSVLEQDGGILYPYVREVLEQLKNDYFLAVVSNCQAGYIEAFLKAHHMEDCFDAHLCWADTKDEKHVTIEKLLHDWQLEYALYVGDTDGDRIQTEKAGLPFVFASYGFGDTKAEYVISSLKELPALCEKLLAAKG